MRHLSLTLFCALNYALFTCIVCFCLPGCVNTIHHSLNTITYTQDQVTLKGSWFFMQLMFLKTIVLSHLQLSKEGCSDI
jgi:hypothetical protein